MSDVAKVGAGVVQYQKGKKIMELDAKEFSMMLDYLDDPKDVRRFVSRGIRAGARIVMRAVERNFTNLRVKNGSRVSLRQAKEKNKKWVSLKMYDKRLDRMPMGTMSIMSRVVKPQGRIFEGGSVGRYRRYYRLNWGEGSNGKRKRMESGHQALRKPQYTGRIIRGDYFERALQETREQAFRQVELSANSFIVRAFNKAHK